MIMLANFAKISFRNFFLPIQSIDYGSCIARQGSCKNNDIIPLANLCGRKKQSKENESKKKKLFGQAAVATAADAVCLLVL